MREEMVVNGVKFLNHPNVQTTPLSERVSFLEQKGMTKEEIQEAIERQQRGDTGGSSVAVSAASPSLPGYNTAVPSSAMTAAAPMMMAAAAPVQQITRSAQRYPAYIRVLWTISSLVGAASILGFLWNYAVQSGYLPWFKSPLMLEASKVKEEKEEIAQQDEALLNGLTDVSNAIQQQTAELTKLCSSLNQKEQEIQNKTLITTQISNSIAEQATNQAIAELRAEVSTLKTLLLTNNREVSTGESNKSTANTSIISAATNVAAPVSSPAATEVAIPVPSPVVPAIVSKGERMIKALKQVRMENSLESLKLAAGILIMYVKNLAENPDVPRYRRIAPGNANFKQKIEPLKHHEELLKSIGFETTGMNMEWRWHTASRTNGDFDGNLAILRALLTALQSLNSPSAASNLSLEEIAQESLNTYDKKKQEVDVAKASTPSTSSAGSTTPVTASDPLNIPSEDKQSHNLAAFMARLEQKTSVKDMNASKPVTITTSPPSTISSLAAAPVKKDEEETKPEAPAAATINESGPAYPQSFTDVMEMLKKGEQVPGIREIEEKLSMDSTALIKKSAVEGEEGDVTGRLSAPAKPWEKLKG